MGTVVRLEDYCKSFKSAEVLKNINLTLESGKVIGLKGKNGSIKCFPPGKWSTPGSHWHCLPFPHLFLS